MLGLVYVILMTPIAILSIYILDRHGKLKRNYPMVIYLTLAIWQVISAILLASSDYGSPVLFLDYTLLQSSAMLFGYLTGVFVLFLASKEFDYNIGGIFRTRTQEELKEIKDLVKREMKQELVNQEVQRLAGFEFERQKTEQPAPTGPRFITKIDEQGYFYFDKVKDNKGKMEIT